MLSGGDICTEWEAGVTGRVEKRGIIHFFKKRTKKQEKNELFKSLKFTVKLILIHVPAEAKQGAVRRVTNEMTTLQQLLTKAKHLQCHASPGVVCPTLCLVLTTS